MTCPDTFVTPFVPPPLGRANHDRLSAVEQVRFSRGTERPIPDSGPAVARALAAVTLLRIRDQLGADALAQILGARLVFGVTERQWPRAAVTSRGYWRLGASDHPDHDYGED
jgi:hypothetical protein